MDAVNKCETQQDTVGYEWILLLKHAGLVVVVVCGDFAQMTTGQEAQQGLKMNGCVFRSTNEPKPAATNCKHIISPCLRGRIAYVSMQQLVLYGPSERVCPILFCAITIERKRIRRDFSHASDPHNKGNNKYFESTFDTPILISSDLWAHFVLDYWEKIWVLGRKIECLGNQRFN